MVLIIDRQHSFLGSELKNKGLDNAPDADANPDKTDFTDEIYFTIAGPAENAEEQELVAIKIIMQLEKMKMV